MRRRAEVLGALFRADIREHRKFTVGGFARWLSEPISYMFVYFILVVVVLHRFKPGYLLLLYCALAPWRFFTASTSDAMSLIQRSQDILLNRTFPREVLPLATLGAEGANLLVAFIFVPPLMLLYRIPPTLNLLWIPVILACLALLVTGPAFLMALFGLYFPDFRGVVQNLIRAGFFLSTGLVPLGRIPGDRLPDAIMLNPFSGIFESLRAVTVYGEAPEPFHVLYPLFFGLVLLAVGQSLYRWRQTQFGKEV